MKRVRMLVDRSVDGLNYKANQVVDFPDGVAKSLVNSGEADGAKEAVAYALEAGAKPLTHTTETQRAAQGEAAELKRRLDELVAAAAEEKDAATKAELEKEIATAEQAKKSALQKLDELKG